MKTKYNKSEKELEGILKRALNTTDNNNDIVLFTGKGGLRQFDLEFILSNTNIEDIKQIYRKLHSKYHECNDELIKIKKNKLIQLILFVNKQLNKWKIKILE